jgi:Bacterial Ig-like domain (group 2)
MRTASSTLFAAAATMLLGCSDSTGPSSSAPIGPGGPDASSFQVSPSTATLQSGQSRQFSVTYSGNPALAGAPASVTWHSSDESVASVSSNGMVLGVTGGQARIVATWGGYQASALVSVVGSMKKHDGPAVCLKRTTRAPARLVQCR